MNYKIADLGQFVAFDQENQAVDFILDHVVLFLPLEILLSVKELIKYLQEKDCEVRKGINIETVIFTWDFAQNMKTSDTIINRRSASGFDSFNQWALRKKHTQEQSINTLT